MNVGQSVWDRLILTLLIIDGVAVGVLSVFLLPVWLGPVPFPVSALIAGAVNVLLVRMAARHTDRTLLVAAPLIAWGVVFLVFALGGFGGSGIVPGDWRGALLALVGGVPALMWLASALPGRAAARAA